MKSRQASEPVGRWEEVLLGGVAGLGVRVLLLGAARRLGMKSGPAAVGGMAGLLGALVGSGLARRHFRKASEHSAPVQAASPQQQGAEAPEGPPGEEPGPLRRGPNGRERHWQLREHSAHTG